VRLAESWGPADVPSLDLVTHLPLWWRETFSQPGWMRGKHHGQGGRSGSGWGQEGHFWSEKERAFRGWAALGWMGCLERG
jgi:hypothetical protein